MQNRCKVFMSNHSLHLLFIEFNRKNEFYRIQTEVSPVKYPCCNTTQSSYLLS